MTVDGIHLKFVKILRNSFFLLNSKLCKVNSKLCLKTGLFWRSNQNDKWDTTLMIMILQPANLLW